MNEMPQRIRVGYTDHAWMQVLFGNTREIHYKYVAEYIRNDIESILTVAIERLDKIYPRNNFVGESKDPGVETVNQARDGLIEIVKWMTSND